jgi:hypothetical protein
MLKRIVIVLSRGGYKALSLDLEMETPTHSLRWLLVGFSWLQWKVSSPNKNALGILSLWKGMLECQRA